MQLLSKTIRTYLIYSTVIIIAGIPLTYLLLLNVIRNETSELLVYQKIKIKSELNTLTSDQQLIYYLKLKNEVHIASVIGSKNLKDSTYQADEFDKSSGEVIPYTVYGFSAIINKRPYWVKLKMSLLAAKALVRTIIKTQIFILAGLLAGLFLINKRMSNRIWEPFYKTLEMLKEYQVNHNPDFKLDHNKVFEFNLLNQAINDLTEKNRQVFLAQKEFTDNAAHEMQTPLAILQSNLELLVQSENLQEEQADLIETMIDVCDRLSRLNISLLLLAKIENKNEQFLQKEDIDLHVLLDNLMKQFSEQFKNRHITCHITETATCRLFANKTLVEILFSNLISNAIKYNIGNGTFQIKINKAHVSFANTGDPIPMDKSKIFERFSKNSASKQSIGLGLAIVKRICEISGYQIAYSFTEQHINKHIFDLYLSDNL